MTTNNDKKAPRRRRSRDSSLYKDLYESQTPADAGTSAPAEGERGYRFVLSDSPEVVAVDQKTVVETLTASLEKIDADQQRLEAELAGNHSANKLEIAQIKGRLADLKRKKSEIEELLISSRTAAEGNK